MSLAIRKQVDLNIGECFCTSEGHSFSEEQPERDSVRLIELYNGKPQALLLEFAYAFGSPLNENDQYTIKSTNR